MSNDEENWKALGHLLKITSAIYHSIPYLIQI